MPDSTGKKKILLVEDSFTQLKMVELLLTKAGYAVVTAANGVKGINQAHTELPDLIVSDILMPELNGYQFCRLIKNDPLRQHIPVILLTNLGEAQDKFWGMESGADAYIVKENEQRELIPQIEALLNRSTEKKTDFIEQPQNAQPEVDSSQHSSRANYMLDKLILESTISNKTRSIIKNAENPKQIMANYFELISKLIDYDVAQLLIRSGSFYYHNIDIAGKAVTRNMLNEAKEALFQKVKITITAENQNSYVFHEEHLVDEEVLNQKLLSRMFFPVLIDDRNMGVLSVHSIRQNAFNAEADNTLRIVCQQIGAVLKYFLALDQHTKWQQKFMEKVGKEVSDRFGEVANAIRELSDQLVGSVDPLHWQNLQKLANLADDSRQIAFATKVSSETGIHRAGTETGVHRMSSETGMHKVGTETGIHRAGMDTGTHRMGSETGIHRVETDTGMPKIRKM